MAKVKSGMTGVSEASRLLRELPIAAENRVLQTSVMAGARALAKPIKAAAPVGDSPHSPDSQKYGSLKKNIKVQAMKSLRRKNQRGARVYTKDAFWGYIREFGTRFIAAIPWFRPAAEAGYSEAFKAQGAALGRGLIREAIRLAKKHGVKP